MQTEGLLGGPGPTGMGLREGGPQSRVGVAELLEQVLTQGASNLHLTAGAKPTVRVNGRPRLGRGRVPADPPGDQAAGGLGIPGQVSSLARLPRGFVLVPRRPTAVAWGRPPAAPAARR